MLVIRENYHIQWFMICLCAIFIYFINQDSLLKPFMEQSFRQFAVHQKQAITSMKWSPHSANHFAVGSAANFGIVGTGAVHIKVLEGSTIKTVAAIDEKDAVFDISWFELNDKFLLIGSGNSQVSFWQIGKNKLWAIPLKAEVHSVECSYSSPLFVAGCMDGNVHLGNTQNAKIMFTLPAHAKNCNQVQWHPSSEKVFASIGGDGLLKLWDHTLPKPNISSFRAHEAEILSLDFNKYQEKVVTSSVDKTIKIWDLRNLTVPVNILQDHRYPPKKVRFSPHLGWLLGSGSFDMNVHFYDLRDPIEPLKFKHAQHTEFVSAIDFNLYDEKLVCSTSWDGRILVWQWDQPQPMIP